MNILGIIPARGGSKGVFRKNLKLLGGKPLLHHTIHEANKARLISRVILSTEDIEIAEAGKMGGVEVPFIRPGHLAEDNSLMIDVVKDAILTMEQRYSYDVDAIILLQPTSPFRTSIHIDEALNIFMTNRPDTVVSTVRVPHQFTPESIYREENGQLVCYSKDLPVYDRKLKPRYLARNGPAILITSRKTVFSKGSFYGDVVISYEMDEMASIDIDTPFDFSIAEFFFQQR